MSAEKVVYVLFYREGCHLCGDMVDQLMPLLSEYPFAELELQDIDRHPESKKLYDTKVPVLVQDSLVLSEYFLDYDKVRQHLNGHRDGSHV